MKNTITMKKNYEFNRVLKKGSYVGGDVLDCFFLKTSFPVNHLGIAIYSKIGNAVCRNRLKRRIKEAYRALEDQTEIGNSFVFLWKKKIEIERGTYASIYKDMEKIFQKIGKNSHEKSNH